MVMAVILGPHPCPVDLLRLLVRVGQETLLSNIPLGCRLLGEDLPKLPSSCCGVQVSQLSSGPRIHPTAHLVNTELMVWQEVT